MTLSCPLCGRVIVDDDDPLDYKPADLGYCRTCDDAVPLVD